MERNIGDDTVTNNSHTGKRKSMAKLLLLIVLLQLNGFAIAKEATESTATFDDQGTQSNQTSSIEQTQEQPSNIWKIIGLRNILSGTQSGEIVSHTFPLTGYEFSAQTKIVWRRDSDEFVFELCYKRNGSAMQTALDIEEHPVIYYVIADQSEGEVKHDLTVIADYYIHAPRMTFDAFGYGHGTSLGKVMREVSRYFVDDVTYIKTIVEDPEHAVSSIQSYNGTLSWTIDNFSIRKQNEIEQWAQFQYSYPFYSGEPGYKLRLIVYANGDGGYINKGVTIGLRILTGRWDETLPSAVPFQTIVTIEDNSLNQNKDHLILSGVHLAGKRGGAYIGFISHDRIVEDRHLINDSMSIKFEVKTSKAD